MNLEKLFNTKNFLSNLQGMRGKTTGKQTLKRGNSQAVNRYEAYTRTDCYG